MTPNDPTMSHDSLDAVIAAYMLAVEAGAVPNRQELLDRHPELVDALQAFFADLDHMDCVTLTSGRVDLGGNAVRRRIDRDLLVALLDDGIFARHESRFTVGRHEGDDGLSRATPSGQ
jgi:hypothetical protein